MRTIIAAYVAALVLLLGLAAVGGAVLYDSRGPSDAIEAAAGGHEYSLTSFELRNFPQKWLYKAGSFLTGRDSGNDDTLRRYFQLGSRIQALEPQGETPELQSLRDERASLLNRVEDIIEGRVTSVLEDQGMAMRFPLFSDLGLIFPPVDTKVASPPRVLVVSPRERIEQARSYLLSPGLDEQTVEQIERDAEAAQLANEFPHGVSALVVNTGGLSTYPSQVSDLDSYESLIDTVFHEWTHSYLAFYPLGSRYFQSNELRTLNESVANLAGHAMAALYFQRYGHLERQSVPAPSATSAPYPLPPPAFDFTTELPDLRRQVEALLSAGQTGQAETLMNQKRAEFQAHGIYIRKLNQAYFAFHGFYADTPGSIDPIGPRLQSLLDRAGSPGEFLRRASQLTSRADLEALAGG